ncbi:hypothetical protein [Chitinilyticum litopenaei]|uniref:hypothetical protein n=1 Tax=Chitinilyticum litopenaei TaxID=1121276 RepID=UPI0004095A7B|nr:hypothetical protein [Chitinilyticum litopenaei]
MTAIALRIDVTHLAGLNRALPLLLDLLHELEAGASVCVALGRDCSGREWSASWRQRRMLGWSALAYGRCWPAPLLARKGRDVLARLAASGLECGLMPPSSVRWRRLVRTRFLPESAILAELDEAQALFQQAFGRQAELFAAPANHMNRTAYRLLQRKGMAWVSACRGEQPFWPVADGEAVQCMALPVNQPDFALLAGSASEREQLLRDSAQWPEGRYAVMQLDAESCLQPSALAALRELLTGWLASGHRIVALGQLAEALALPALPHHALEWGAAGAHDRQGLAFP